MTPIDSEITMRCKRKADSQLRFVVLGLPLAMAIVVLTFGCRRSSEPIMNSPATVDAVQTQDIVFADVTAACGIDFTYRNGQEAGAFSIVESLGGGVGIADFDRDGWNDVFFPGGGELKLDETLTGLPHGLFRQVAQLEFEEVSRQARAHESYRYSHGCTIADFDNDGFPDVIVTGYGGLELFQNQGDGTFRETHTEANLNDSQWSSSAGWGDFNSDGNLDLYVAHYVNWSWEFNPECFAAAQQRDVCPPRTFRGLDDTLYLSRGDGTFDDATQSSGLRPEGKGLGVLVADIDSDGDVDIYVANDTVDNFCYLNDGSGHFDEQGTITGLATDDRGAPNGSMGVAILDYDANQLPDLWVANYENESFALYRNEGQTSFTHVSQSTGIYSIGSTNVGFGTAAGDFDKDGDEDLVISNGHVVAHPRSGEVKQKPLLLLNEAGNFHVAAFAADQYFGQVHHGRGLALADLDNDGDLEMAVSNNNEPAAVLSNETITKNQWLGLRLIGRGSNRDAIGARASLHTTAGVQLRTSYGGGSYLSQSDNRLFWGLPDGARATHLQITWPSGVQQTIELAECDRYVSVVEP